MLAVAACASTHVSTDYDHAARFSTFHTFALMVRPHPGSPNPLVAQHTYDAIRDALVRKGFTCVADPEAADFTVDFTVGARDRLDVSPYPWPYAGAVRAGWWGGQVDVRQYQEGMLAIDVFDAHSQKPVWHGSAKKEIVQSDVDHAEATIREVVTELFAAFPPGGA